MLNDGNILCGCWDALMNVYNIKFNTFAIGDIRIHKGIISNLLKINENQFISCSGNKTIRVWEY